MFKTHFNSVFIQLTKQQIECIFKRFNQNHELNAAKSEQTKNGQNIIPQHENVTKIRWMNTENEWHATENGERQKIIILFTYHRSGSSFTGQLLNQHPGQF